MDDGFPEGSGGSSGKPANAVTELEENFLRAENVRYFLGKVAGESLTQCAIYCTSLWTFTSAC